jgi:hypothetical protein
VTVVPAQASVPQSLDCPDQCRGPFARHEVQHLHEWPEEGQIEVDRKVLADLAVFDKPAFAALAVQAKAQLDA